ncbi:MAG: response regulator [bacterium]
MADSVSILMIDDNPADGDIVRRHLSAESIPWEVSFELVHNLQEAQDKLFASDFDIIFLDYRFPFGDGFDLLTRLRDRGIELPVVMLTGQGSEKVAGKAVKNNLNDYLPKNELSPENLKEALETALQSSEPGQLASREPRKNKPGDDIKNYFSMSELFTGLSPVIKNFSRCNFIFPVIEGKAGSDYLKLVDNFILNNSNCEFEKLFPGRVDDFTFLGYLICSHHDHNFQQGYSQEFLDELIDFIIDSEGDFSDRLPGLVSLEIKFQTSPIDPANLLNRALDAVCNCEIPSECTVNQLQTAVKGNSQNG